MQKDADLTQSFNGAALKRTRFEAYLLAHFGDESTAAIKDFFTKTGLPVPDEDEYLRGSEGAIVFLNRYGLVIRIENAETRNSKSGYSSDRINDSPWVLAPLATIPAGQEAVIEICPGCAFETDDQAGFAIDKLMRRQGQTMWDVSHYNVGRVPVATPSFPEGIPVVIDRGAVRNLTINTSGVRRALRKSVGMKPVPEKYGEAAAAEAALYAPLQQAFNAGWHANNLKDFWRLCQQYLQDGKLVAGWNDPQTDGHGKTGRAVAAAAAYEERLSGTKRPNAKPRNNIFYR